MPGKNVRASTSPKTKVTKPGEHLWFHLECYNHNKKGHYHPIDFPDVAKSEFTECAVCRQPINKVDRDAN